MASKTSSGKPSGEMVIHRYDEKNRLIRRVGITRCHPEGTAGQEAVPCRIILEAFHPAVTNSNWTWWKPADGGQPLKSVLTLSEIA